MPDIDPSTAVPPSDAEREWVNARAAALGHTGPVHDTPPRPGPDGRIILAADPAAPAPTRLRASDETGPGAAVVAVHTIHVGAGEELVVQAPDGRPVSVVAGALEVADGGRVVLETHVELQAARARFGAEAPIVAVGKDGGPGGNGRDGESATHGQGPADGERGHDGDAGGDGDPGPGGIWSFGHLAGTLTVVAGGGSGGNGGNGGRGGNGRSGGRGKGGNGGDGGAGGRGGKAGDGGTIIITFDTIAPDASIHQVTITPKGGNGGQGGAGGKLGPGDRYRRDGNRGGNGDTGAPGEPPVIIVRPRGGD